jgi:dihydrofolate synthase / folylpolyglutamate synthase
MTYDQSVRYLLSLGRELASPQQAHATKFDLVNIRVLSAHIGNPHQAFRSVHVAGTNGKGSTSAMLAAILEAAGLRAGLYTSPHLVRINERIRIGPGEISDADFAATFSRIHAAIEELLASGALAAHPTYFECVTAMAFDYFARQNVDLAIMEVGMGGRLDSTNIIVPEVAIITKIDFDHENFLGHSIEAIAAEKAGIIKPTPEGSAGPGAWVVGNAGNPVAAEVIRRRAAEQNARLVEVENAYAASNISAHDGRYGFTASAQSGPPLKIALPLAGRYQIQNALTAIAAARLLAERGFPVTDAAIAKGLAAVHWPGRIERLQSRPAVYLDGTHNPAGARELAAFWEEQFTGRRIHLIYGAMRDKAVDEVAGLLFPLAATVILTQSPQPRSISADTLASLTQHFTPKLEVIPDPAAALDHAIEQAAPDDIVFATGSLYLVGDLLRHWAVRSSIAASASSATRP